MSDETTPDLTALLAEHWNYDLDHDGDHWLCDCGEQIGNRQTPDLDMAQRAHLAEQITAAGFGPVRAVEHVVHVTVEPVAEDVVWCDECEEWVTSGAPERREHSPGETCVEADERAAANWARAESAEAALAGVVAKVEALRLDLNADANYRVTKGSIGHRLHRLLAPTPDREEER